MSHGTYTESSVISCNVSYKREIEEDTLIGILTGKIQPGESEEWQPHLMTFFNELPQSFIVGVMEENQLSLAQLARVFESLPEVCQEDNFKELTQREQD